MIIKQDKDVIFSASFGLAWIGLAGGVGWTCLTSSEKMFDTHLAMHPQSSFLDQQSAFCWFGIIRSLIHRQALSKDPSIYTLRCTFSSF